MLLAHARLSLRGLRSVSIGRFGFAITKTPFRVSFFGGGTDLPDYFNEYGGCVLGSAINKYLYVTVNSLPRFYENRIRLSYSKLENVNSASELTHDIVRTILCEQRKINPEHFLDMHTFADLPASSGVGSSSAFTVGFLSALSSLNGERVNCRDIAREAVIVERVLLKDLGGWQDQYFSAYGGFRKIGFSHNDVLVEPVHLSRERVQYLEKACLMVFTGGARLSSNIQLHFKDLSTRKLTLLHKIKEFVAQGVDILSASSSDEVMLKEFGCLLNQSWKLKRSLSPKISTDKIDTIYNRAIHAGAYGGKLCGAGRAGFILFIAPHHLHEKIKHSLSGFDIMDIRFEAMGARVLYNNFESEDRLACPLVETR